MPKLGPIKDRELIAILRTVGFVELRHNASSHKILAHPDGRRTIVAMHPGKDISITLLRRILRQIEISPDEFSRLRKK